MTDAELMDLLDNFRKTSIAVARFFLWLALICAMSTAEGGVGWTWIFCGLFAGAGVLAGLVAFGLHKACQWPAEQGGES